MRALSFVLSCLATLCFSSLTDAELPVGVVDTQPQGDVPLTPLESLAKISVPDGFHVTLFAGEPDVYQPIAMEFDDRGRLWVVENFSYPDWKSKDRDRILIFEDRDNDGQFDKRIVFADNLSNLTGIALGYGGVWCCSTPNLIFIPDRNRDDKPDGPPVIKLDGWNDESDDIEHNVFNGMTWGPDGWMYGSHGILADSFVGKPGSADVNRQRLNCGIWRYHPVSEQFEVVAHGTTNPWGIDFNEVGEGFFTNCVIGHLWHLIPGAHYKRMYGKHYNPYTYIEIDACSDHLHWGGGHWTDSRGGQGVHSVAGGGHAHVGSMVYLGGKWPAEFHGSMFTCNLHGNRVNRDPIRQEGSGYVATHGPDFLMANDPWFRGLAIKYGPDGNVFVSDWTDLGECHDKDGTHRSSGRIYKISFGDDPTETSHMDLATSPSNELLGTLLKHPNAWHRRHALRILQERRQATEELPSKFDVQDAVRSAIEVAADTTRPKLERLRALWLAGGDADGLEHLARDADPHVQAWYIRLRGTSVFLSNPAVSKKPRKEFVELIQLARDKSTALNVKLEIASTLRNGNLTSRYVGEAAWDMAEALIDGLPSQADPNLTPMVWYAIEKMHRLSPRRFVRLAIPKKDEPINAARLQILELIVRKSMSYDRRQVTNLQYLVEAASLADDTSIRLAMLRGIRRALQGTKQVSMPNGWEALYAEMQVHSENDEVVALQRIAEELAVKFRHADVIDQLRKRATDGTQRIVDRERAVRQLVSHLGVDGCGLSLSTLGATERRLLPEVYRLFGNSNAAEAESYLKRSVKSLKRLMLQRGAIPEARLSKDIRNALVGALVAKSERVNWLLDAIESKEISSKAILPVDAMQIERLEDKQINARLRRLWGVARKSSKEKQKQIAAWKGVLTDAYVAKADLANGRHLFHENCGKCHRLFGVGNEIGPDLTGSDRRNLDYVLQNVIDPSSVVGRDYRLTSLILESGLVATGVVVAESPSSITLQKPDGKETIARSEIEETNSTRLSLMPEGQFDRMGQAEVRDLIGYLRLSTDLAD